MGQHGGTWDLPLEASPVSPRWWPMAVPPACRCTVSTKSTSPFLRSVPGLLLCRCLLLTCEQQYQLIALAPNTRIKTKGKKEKKKKDPTALPHFVLRPILRKVPGTSRSLRKHRPWANINLLTFYVLLLGPT